MSKLSEYLKQKYQDGRPIQCIEVKELIAEVEGLEAENSNYKQAEADGRMVVLREREKKGGA